MVAAAIGAAAAVAGAVNNIASSGGGGAAGAGSAGQSIQSQQYSFYGPHVSTQPMSGEKAPDPKTMSPSKASTAGVENPARTPTQAVGEQQAKGDYQNIWADRLSKYLDYNTRSLG